jgi:long-chain acyl-CoA synthetase
MAQTISPGISASVPPLASNPVSLPALFLHTARKRPDVVALRVKKYGLWTGITWAEYESHVRNVAGALLSWGIEPDQGVAVLGDNRPEWVMADLGIQMAGGVTAAIYATNAPDGVQYVIEHSDSRAIVVENAEQLDKVLEVRGTCPTLERIVVMDMKGLAHFRDPMVMSFDAMLEDGAKWNAANPGKLEARLTQRKGEDAAMFIYTSGTTGRPKGAVLTHRNLIFTASSFGQANPLYETDEALSFLPLSHIVERLLSVVQAAYYGYTVNFVENPETVLENLREVRPTIFFAVPRVWEKMMSGIEVRMTRADTLKRVAYRWAAQQGREGAIARLSGQSASLAANLAYLTVLRSLKQKLGLDRVRYVLSGAAPIAPSVLEFFHGLGVPIREGYGQTEGTAAATICQGWPIKLGTVGQALPGIEVRIAPDGEILVRGENVFKGYHKDPKATSDTLRDGWLHTGDIGELDAQGNLSITGRKKDIFITAAGKNIAPAFLENKLKASPYINDAVLIGDGKNYLTALIVLDEDSVSEWAQSRKIPFTTYADLAQNPEVQKLIEAEVDAVNKTLSRVEGVKKFRILPKRLHQEDGDVTPTLKVKRTSIMKSYGHLVEEMYRSG